MVFYDILQPNSSIHVNNKTAANLLDRFFALVLDYLVISPFVLFLLYISLGSELGYLKRHPQAAESEIYLVLLAFGYILFFSLIQSVFITFWRATPGQHFLKMHLEFQEAQTMIFFRAFLRQSSFWISFLFFGIPLLSMLTSKSRRTFYDKLSDVVVLTQKKESQIFGFEKEYKYWQSFMATVLLFFGFLLSAITWKTYSQVVNRAASFYSYQAQNYFCEELSDVGLENRLPTAIALNLAKQLSDDCLDREANFTLWKEKKSDYSLAYYAKSLTTDDLTKEKKYLLQSCQGQDLSEFNKLTFGCKLADSFLNKKFKTLYSSLNQKNFLSDSLRYELGLILGKTKDLESNFSKINKYKSSKLIKKYQLKEAVLQKYYSKSNRMPASVGEKPAVSAEDQKIIELIGEL